MVISIHVNGVDFDKKRDSWPKPKCFWAHRVHCTCSKQVQESGYSDEVKYNTISAYSLSAVMIRTRTANINSFWSKYVHKITNYSLFIACSCIDLAFGASMKFLSQCMSIVLIWYIWKLLSFSTRCCECAMCITILLFFKLIVSTHVRAYSRVVVNKRSLDNFSLLLICRQLTTHKKWVPLSSRTVSAWVLSIMTAAVKYV